MRLRRSSQAVRGGVLVAGLAAVSAVVVFVVLTAAGVGGDSGDQASKTTPHKPAAARHLTAAQRYQEAVSVHENGTGVSGAPPPPDSFPIPASSFKAPIATYKRYAGRQLGLVATDVTRLRAALKAGSRSRAKAQWRTAWGHYLRLGAVYGAFGALDTAIDGLPGGLPHGVKDQHFTGLHRIEYGLYTGQPLRSLLPVVDRLATDVRRLRTRVPGTKIDPLDYVTRSHEILEDAQRDFLSGADVKWSDEGVLATAQAASATSVVFGTIEPLFNNQDAAPHVSNALHGLHETLDAIHRAHHGTWPTNAQLTHAEHVRLDGALGAALENLSEVPGAAETSAPPTIPHLPKKTS
ncbi:MAG TPA: EfeM/EfeO family lipoprotein [Baekduia sp.]